MAANLNKLLLIGRVGQEPEVKDFESGNKITTISLAVAEHYTNRDGQDKENTPWFRVLFFGKAAKTIQDYVHKGDALYVEGSVVQREYTNRDGVKVSTWEVRATGFQFLMSKPQQSNSPAPDTSYPEDLPWG